MRVLKQDKSGGTLYVPLDASRNGAPRSKQSKGAAARKVTQPRFDELDRKYRAAITDQQRRASAAVLGVRADALDEIGVGWATADDLKALRASGKGWEKNPPDGAYAFAERDGKGRIVGFSFRTTDGRKGSPSSSVGARRGLIVPSNLHQTTGPVLVVEGASDVAACVVMGLPAVGRPSNSGGADDIAKLLDSREVLIVGENDAKAGGAWPGRDGANRVATRIASARGEPVKVSLPPKGVKDVREWLQLLVDNGLDLTDASSCQAAGAKVLEALQAGTTTDEPVGINPTERLVQLAQETYRFGRTDKDESFAVPLAGPNLAVMLKRSGDALRAKLAKAYRAMHGQPPKSSALTDALTVLTGDALEAEPERVHLRLAANDGGIVIDLGDSEGRAVVVRPDGWQVADHSPVPFRRTALTGVLPVPERSGTLDELRNLLNVSADTWPLIVGWLVAALLPDIPHAILLLSGIQGTGKSSAARVLVTLIDHSSAPLRSQPRDVEQWAVAAAGSWTVALDNLSHIPAWLSDALCKASTGDGLVKRALYTDGDLAVLAFRRVVLLTSIDAGSLRGDLGDRLLLADLEPIPESQRRTEKELDDAFTARRARIFGALLDAVSAVLAKLPDVRPERLPRMADFGRVLAACDAAGVTDGALALYLDQSGRIAGDVIEGDAFAAALMEFIRRRGKWEGTASDLLAAMTSNAERLPQGWPKRNGVGGHIKRLIPALVAEGVRAIIPLGRTKRGRIIQLESSRDITSPSSPDGASPDGAMLMRGDEADELGDAGDDPRFRVDQQILRDGDDAGEWGGDAESGIVTQEPPEDPEKTGADDAGDDSDDRFPPLSDAEPARVHASEPAAMDSDGEWGAV
jgi:hypothetical protein